ncbi:MAG TPA: helix-turn-helix transcriptional regulator [Streptosporangiaceae bacterium]
MPVTEQAAESLAALLRRLRADAGLTQEELASAAGLSPRSISDLERGLHATSRRDTARLLADALNLTGGQRAVFEATALGRGNGAGPLVPAPEAALARSVAATTPRLPRDIKEFTGRDADLARLTAAVAEDGGVVEVCAIDGMAGVGKSVFTIHAAHLLQDSFPDGQIYLSLNAHLPGHLPVDPADAIVGLLIATGVPRHQIPDDLAARSALWRAHVAGKRMLLLLDDAAGHEQVRPLLPGTPGSLVLITSRRNLTALDGATSICLETMPPEQAAALLIRLADRPGLDPADPAIAVINALCGYLPLAIAMMARQLRHHPAWTTESLASYLAAARGRLQLMHAENLSVAAAFDMSYQDLTDEQQRMFRRLGLNPGTDIDAYAAAALDASTPDVARLRLDELFDHHLLTEHASGRYRMHDLIKEHARALAETEGAEERDAAVGRLVRYYVRATEAAGHYFNRRQVRAVESSFELPALGTVDDAAAWTEAERGNVHAIVDLAAQRGWSDPALAIVTSVSGFLRTYGHWINMRTLHMTALEAARQAGDRRGEISILANLGVVQRLTADYSALVATLNRALKLCVQQQDSAGQARALVGLSRAQQITADFRTATSTAKRALDLSIQAGELLGQADALKEVGRVQLLTADYAGARSSHSRALELYRSLDHPFGEASSLRYLGSTYQDPRDFPVAAGCFADAMEMCRRLNDRLGLAFTLSYLGVSQHLVGHDRAAASRSLTEALALHREFGHRFGLAEALISLGDLNADSDPVAAREYYRQALALASEISASYQQALALEGIGTMDLTAAGGPAAQALLRRAREIYRRMGSPRYRQIDQLLGDG